MPHCKKCERPLEPIEIALTKKLINRASTEYMCLTCLSDFFKVSEQLLLDKAEEFRKQGCGLFTSFPQ